MVIACQSPTAISALALVNTPDPIVKMQSTSALIIRVKTVVFAKLQLNLPDLFVLVFRLLLERHVLTPLIHVYRAHVDMVLAHSNRGNLGIFKF